MPYNKTEWINRVTRLNANNMNKIEQGIQDAHVDIEVLNYNVGENIQEISELRQSLQEFEPGAPVHVGVLPPSSTNKIWIDTSKDSFTPPYEGAVWALIESTPIITLGAEFTTRQDAPYRLVLFDDDGFPTIAVSCGVDNALFFLYYYEYEGDLFTIEVLMERISSTKIKVTAFDAFPTHPIILSFTAARLEELI